MELIAKVRSGVAQVRLEREGKTVATGTAFLVQGGLVTNSHVIRKAGDYDAVAIRFDDNHPEDTTQYIRLAKASFDDAVVAESSESDADYAYVHLDEDEFGGRHRFTFAKSPRLDVGQQVVFVGFPFGMPQLTCHLGHVSSLHIRNGVDIIQIDGSVNGGNSGGPLLSLESGQVVGIVTRAWTGLETKFDDLLEALRKNQEVLKQPRAHVSIGGIDTMDAFRATLAAVEQVAYHLRRSANVGIGYAFASEELRKRIAEGEFRRHP